MLVVYIEFILSIFYILINNVVQFQYDKINIIKGIRKKVFKILCLFISLEFKQWWKKIHQYQQTLKLLSLWKASSERTHCFYAKVIFAVCCKNRLFCFLAKWHYLSNTIWIMVWRMFVYRTKMYMLLWIRCYIKILPIYSDITLFQVGSVFLIYLWFFLYFSIMCIYFLSYVMFSLVFCLVFCRSLFVSLSFLIMAIILSVLRYSASVTLWIYSICSYPHIHY